MTLSSERVIVGVRFHRVGKIYHFDASAYPQVHPADYVIVETARGRQLGQVMGMVPPQQADLTAIKPIKSPATSRDLMMKKLWEAKEVAALITVREIASHVNELSEDVKFVQADYNYDGSVLTVLYTSEEIVNTNNLRRRLQNEFNSRIELRRIGARDAAKLLGEYGACGAPRCCSTHLTEFSPISIKMAKAQGISLNPSEITGMCGRLRCCLVYEYEQYVEARKTLPKRGKKVGTPQGEGKVIDVNPLAQTVSVLVEEVRYEFGQDDIIPLAELKALQDKAGAGCSKEGQAGPCECGARVRSGAPAGEASPNLQARMPELPDVPPPTTTSEAASTPEGTAKPPRSRGRGRSRRSRRSRPSEKS